MAGIHNLLAAQMAGLITAPLTFATLGLLRSDYIYSTSNASICTFVVTGVGYSNTYSSVQVATSTIVTLIVPSGVTSVSVAGVGGGGGFGGYGKASGTAANNYRGGGGGGGGALAWKNNIAVTPGDVLTLAAGWQGDSGANGTSVVTATTQASSGYAGSAGGDSYLLKNGVLIFMAKGGSGGARATTSAAGVGGTGGTTSNTALYDFQRPGGNGSTGTVGNGARTGYRGGAGNFTSAAVNASASVYATGAALGWGLDLRQTSGQLATATYSASYLGTGSGYEGIQGGYGYWGGILLSWQAPGTANTGYGAFSSSVESGASSVIPLWGVASKPGYALLPQLAGVGNNLRINKPSFNTELIIEWVGGGGGNYVQGANYGEYSDQYVKYNSSTGILLGAGSGNSGQPAGGAGGVPYFNPAFSTANLVTTTGNAGTAALQANNGGQLMTNLNFIYAFNGLGTLSAPYTRIENTSQTIGAGAGNSSNVVGAANSGWGYGGGSGGYIYKSFTTSELVSVVNLDFYQLPPGGSPGYDVACCTNTYYGNYGASGIAFMYWK